MYIEIINKWVIRLRIEYNKFEFTPVFRQEIFNEIKVLCREEHVEFMKLFEVFSSLDMFLESKCKKKDNYSKQYFTRLINIRVRDHFSSALILASQGYTIDAISLTRSALEDLFVILNFYLNEDFFKNWTENNNKFKIKPGKLRNNPKIARRDREFYNAVYEILSNIVHPRQNSIYHMMKFHPTVVNRGSEGISRVKKDINLINLSFYIYNIQIINLFKTIYINKDDLISLEEITQKVSLIIDENDLNDKLSNI